MSAPFSIIRDTDTSPPRGGVIAIGNFDGVHLGHRTVIDAAIAMARAAGKPAYAVTFEPHPRSFFQPNVPQFRLSSERDKLRLLAATGLDGAVVMGFDAKRATTSAVDFINGELVGRLGVSGIAVGYDFHFGKGRAGSPTLLQSEGARLHIPVHVEKRHETHGITVSSGSIRDALNQGHVDRAAMMLGYPWFVSAEVRHGDKRGRDLGYPTANLALDPGCGLRHGIYAVRAGIGGKLVDGVASFGTRPMFDNGAPLLEVHLFEFSGDLYGERLDVAFIAFLRDEMKLDSLDALVAQMNTDSAAARAALGAHPGAFPALGEIGAG
jgi:riboflavin kinase/FMN adenylyltransferase